MQAILSQLFFARVCQVRHLTRARSADKRPTGVTNRWSGFSGFVLFCFVLFSGVLCGWLCMLICSEC